MARRADGITANDVVALTEINVRLVRVRTELWRKQKLAHYSGGCIVPGK